MEYAQPPEGAVEIMLDLETMGTDPWSPIVAIGAVRFEVDQKQRYEPFYQAITLESAMQYGLKPSAGTITWWMGQGKEAQAVFHDPNAVALPLALDAFTDWYASRPDNLWGNSAAFDLGLMKDAYKACGKIAPWAFYRERCYRTLKGLPGMDRFDLQRSGTHHNALDDAISQARHCVKMLKYLDGKQQYEAAKATVRDVAQSQLALDPQPAAAIGLVRVKPEGGQSAPPLGIGTAPLQR